MPTDIEIARSVTPLPITEVAKNAGVDVKHLIPYGFDKAKVDYSLLNEPTDHQAKLVLVTAINPRLRARVRPPRPSVWPMLAPTRRQECRGPARAFARPRLWR